MTRTLRATPSREDCFDSMTIPVPGALGRARSSFTARLSRPYVGRPDDFGMLVTEEEPLYAIARKAHEAGWQIGIHANGELDAQRKVLIAVQHGLDLMA